MSSITADYGDEVELLGQFTHKGEPVDPDDVICSVRAKDGTVTHPEVERLDKGQYLALFTPLGPATTEEAFEAVMDGYGENRAATRELTIKIRKRKVPRPPAP